MLMIADRNDFDEIVFNVEINLINEVLNDVFMLLMLNNENVDVSSADLT